MSEEWYISTNEEWFGEGPLDSREEAIQEGREQYEGEAFYIGKRGDIHVLDPVSIMEDLYDSAANEVHDEAGPDAADQWPERRSVESMREAGEKVRTIFIELYGEPSVFKIEQTEHIPAEQNVLK